MSVFNFVTGLVLGWFASVLFYNAIIPKYFPVFGSTQIQRLRIKYFEARQLGYSWFQEAESLRPDAARARELLVAKRRRGKTIAKLQKVICRQNKLLDTTIAAVIHRPRANALKAKE